MTEPSEEIAALLAERDGLRDDLFRARGRVAWVISDIYRQQHHDPDFPEHLCRWMDLSILPRLRLVVGWGPVEDGDESGPKPH